MPEAVLASLRERLAALEPELLETGGGIRRALPGACAGLVLLVGDQRQCL